MSQPGQAQQIDLSSLVATLGGLIQTLGTNAKNLNAILNSGSVAASTPVSYFHINGAGTFVAKDTSAVLLSLNINQTGTGCAGTIYDASGTASLPGTAEVAVLDFGTIAPASLSLGPPGRGLSLNSGIVIVTTGSADVTVGFQ